jgi:DNA replication protein DnaC
VSRRRTAHHRAEFKRAQEGRAASDLLVLDDLFLAKRISGYAAEVLQTIVYQRYQLRRPIVVTSNRSVQD